jgi:hypothetical protein
MKAMINVRVNIDSNQLYLLLEPLRMQEYLRLRETSIVRFNLCSFFGGWLSSVKGTDAPNLDSRTAIILAIHPPKQKPTTPIFPLQFSCLLRYS